MCFIRGSVNIVESNIECNGNSGISSRIVRKRYLCSSCKAPVVLDDDDVIECARGYKASKDAPTPNLVINVTILDERKHKVNLHVNLDQIEVC